MVIKLDQKGHRVLWGGVCDTQSNLVVAHKCCVHILMPLLVEVSCRHQNEIGLVAKTHQEKYQKMPRKWSFLAGRQAKSAKNRESRKFNYLDCYGRQVRKLNSGKISMAPRKYNNHQANHNPWQPTPTEEITILGCPHLPRLPTPAKEITFIGCHCPPITLWLSIKKIALQFNIIQSYPI